MAVRHAGIIAAALLSASCENPPPQPAQANIVNDVTQLNPIAVERIATPRSIEDLSSLIAGHAGPISIGGGRFSQGGQTACTGCLFIDMRGLNHVLSLDEKAHIITVQGGITWREIQEAIDPKDLSPKIMQSFSNFTVGGALSVNCHGDYVGLGPVVESVRSIKLVLADGSVVTASRDEHRDLFDAAIGGYGGIGVIAEATLDLADNVRMDRVTIDTTVKDYPAWHEKNIVNGKDVILHHGVIYPPAYTHVAAETSTLTDKPVTVKDRLVPLAKPGSAFSLGALANVAAHIPFGAFIHERIYDPLTSSTHAVVWRNFEAAEDVYSLEPPSRAQSTYALEEYFVPVDRFEEFVPKMGAILNKHHANVLNVAIRHARADHEALLAWAKADVYSFVLYYEQGTDEKAKAAVGEWTRALV
ncbi:MAG TPA: FAD-binding oxidoreductase, partial [Hyphomonadaceae bacterium]|nr:FAD-binding oxidoreductase [Hyphomonadaceae bacterium]